jgi:hypothetical protein
MKNEMGCWLREFCGSGLSTDARKIKVKNMQFGRGEQKNCYPRSVTLGLASLLGAPCGRWQDFRDVIMVGCWVLGDCPDRDRV